MGKNYAIETAVLGFDFTKAAAALAGCGWRFTDALESPTPQELESIARELCARVIDAGHGTAITQGPIHVSTFGWHRDEEDAQARAVMTLKIELVPVFSHAVYVDFAHIDQEQTAGG